MSGKEALDTLSRRYPIEAFEGIEFREHAAVRDGRLADDVEIDEETGAYKGDGQLPPDVSVCNHAYFYHGVKNTNPSMTGFLKTYFPETFDADVHAKRISEGSRILSDHKYKYYRFGRDLVETTWIALDYDLTALDAFYEMDPIRHANDSVYRAFRDLHDTVVRVALIKAWADNGREQSMLGKIMHRTIELALNENPQQGARFETIEFGYFRNFQREWVEPRGLVIYRTELSLCYFDIKLFGMIDAMFVFRRDLASGKPIRRCVLVDWKRANDLQFAAKYEKRMANAPFDHLELCDGSKYYAQLNGYKCILERYTAYKVVSMYIAVFHPNESNYRVHKVPDLQRQIRQCIDAHR